MRLSNPKLWLKDPCRIWIQNFEKHNLPVIWREINSKDSVKTSGRKISATETTLLILERNLCQTTLPVLVKSMTSVFGTSRHIESSYILQPPKYLLLFVNRFRYLTNNIIKDRCPIPLDTTVMLGPLKFNLQATIDHHGPSIDSGHYTASINCCKKNILLQRSQNYGVWNYW